MHKQSAVLQALSFVCVPEAPLDSVSLDPLQPSSSQPLAVVKLVCVPIDKNKGGIRPWVWVALQAVIALEHTLCSLADAGARGFAVGTLSRSRALPWLSEAYCGHSRAEGVLQLFRILPLCTQRFVRVDTSTTSTQCRA